VPFIAPALASPLPENFEPAPGEWIAELKVDGHRVIVQVGGDAPRASLFDDGRPIQAWSRDAKPRLLPARVREALAKLPDGTYDGELCVPGGRSYGVTEIANRDALRFVMFDVLEMNGHDFTKQALGRPGSLIDGGPIYDERRAALEELAPYAGVFKQTPDSLKSKSILKRLQVMTGAVHLAWSVPINSWEEAKTLALAVWARDGEGLILKRRASLYRVGKRTKDWLKIKQLRSAVMTLVGYQAGKLGPHSVWVLRDDEGQETSVKWKSLAELAKVDAEPEKFVGRRCRIDFQERTPDGSYRHPRWDCWEDE